MVDSQKRSPVGRFQILTEGLPSPACCALCGSHNRPVVAFQLIIRQYGAVMFCTTCFQSIVFDLGEELNVVTRGELEYVQKSLGQAKELVQRYEALMGGLHADITRVVTERLDSFSALPDISIDESTVEDSTTPSDNYFLFGDLQRTGEITG